MDLDLHNRTEDFVQHLGKVQKALYAFIRSLVDNWAEADEISQETSLVLWRKFSEFQPGTNFLSWACQVAYYEVLRYRKRRNHQELLLPSDLLATLATEGTNEADNFNATHEALQVCLEHLSVDERRLVQLHYAQDESANSIAAQIQRSVSAVHKALSRIRWKLFECVRRRLAAEGSS